MKKVVLATAIAAISMTTGCVQRVADLTVASTKNVNMNSSQFTEGARVTADDTTAIILFPLGTPSVKESVDKAIEKDRCAVALDSVVVDHGFMSFIVGAQWFTTEGTLIMDESKEGCKGAGARSRNNQISKK